MGPKIENDRLGAQIGDVTDWEALRRQLLAICEIESIKARATRAERADADEIICRCKQVTRGRIADLVDAGVPAADIGRITGVGQTCGGCAIAVEAIIGRSTLAPATLVGRQKLDKLHTRFTFHVPDVDAVPVAGDHVLVEASIYGRTLSRAYTLTGWDVGARTFEIIVRYEANGVFSRWLHDFADAESGLRLSRPTGAHAQRPDEPVFFLAGGIGVTPALTRLRAQDALSPAIWLHWSARFGEQSQLTSHVEELVAAAPLAIAVLRDTARDGRMTRGEVAETLPFQGIGTVHLCGPVTFMDDMGEALAAAGWPAERVVRESFVSAVAPPLRPTGAVFDPKTDLVVAESFSLRPIDSIVDEATRFLKQFYAEHGATMPFVMRLAEIEQEIDATGTYRQTYDELAYGAKLAWRNATRCVGRFFWQMLTVHDMRHVTTEEGVFAAIVEHIRWATNGGDLRPAITVFRPDGPEIRLLNPQLILYAGYRQPDGSVRGDPKNVEFTEFVQALGWEGPGTRFDVLPVVIRIGTQAPRLFELPKDLVLEVALEHPERAAFAQLGLKWFALPAVADMALDVGGLHYTAAPSSGVYMGTEIGSFNLSDPRRYNLLPQIAETFGYDTSDDNPLWRDQALLEVNRAVLWSFRRAGVRILDHHALSKYFMKFMANEKAENRPVYGHWPWIVPPMSSNLSDIWHDKSLKNVIVKPNYFYQKRGGYLATITDDGLATTCPVDAGYGPPIAGTKPPIARCPVH